MSESFIPASEFETASNAVKNILGQPVEEIEITDILPPLNDIADSNKVFKGKLAGCVCWITVLFARVNPNEFSNRGIAQTVHIQIFWQTVFTENFFEPEGEGAGHHGVAIRLPEQVVILCERTSALLLLFPLTFLLPGPQQFAQLLR